MASGRAPHKVIVWSIDYTCHVGDVMCAAEGAPHDELVPERAPTDGRKCPLASGEALVGALRWS